MTSIDETVKILTKASAEFHIQEKSWPWPVLNIVKGENINKVPDIGEVYDIDRNALLEYLPKYAKVDTRDYAIILTGKYKGNVVHKSGMIRYDFGSGVTLTNDFQQSMVIDENNTKNYKKGSKLDREIEENSKSNVGAIDEYLTKVDIPSITKKPMAMKANINVNSADMFEYKKIDNAYEIIGLKNEEEIKMKYNDIILNIPESHRGLPIESIGESAFEGSKITRLYLSGNLRKVESYAFASNNISVLDLNTGIKVIEKGAFTDNKLPKINIPNQVEFIGSYAFADNSLVDVTLPRNIESIETYSFANNNITKVELPKSIIAIGPSAFAYNKITHINFPGGLISIGKSAFEGNRLTSLSIPKSVELVFESAFKYNGPQNNSEDLVANKYSGVWHISDNKWIKKGN